MKVITLVAIVLVCIAAVDAVKPQHRQTSKPVPKPVLNKVEDICKGNPEANVAALIGTKADHDKAVAENKKQWTHDRTPKAALLKYGIQVGENGQTLFWSPEEKVWRFGDKSYDPATGKSRVNYKVPTSKIVKDIVGPAVDMCKINPSVCKGKAEPFCWVQTQRHLCCEKGGCPNKIIKGLSRSKMPQISDGWTPSNPKTDLTTWLNFHDQELKKTKPTETFKCEDKDLPADQFTPVQDEINLGKSLSIACEIKQGKLPSFFVVTKDNYIYDGHHRWSAYRACQKWIKGCKVGKVRVKQCNQSALWMITVARSLLNPAAPSGNSNRADVITFAGLLQIQERYGPNAHETEDDAREAYVAHTVERLKNAGMEPRNGVQDLYDMWDNEWSSKAGW